MRVEQLSLFDPKDLPIAKAMKVEVTLTEATSPAILRLQKRFKTKNRATTLDTIIHGMDRICEQVKPGTHAKLLLQDEDGEIHQIVLP